MEDEEYTTLGKLIMRKEKRVAIKNILAKELLKKEYILQEGKIKVKIEIEDIVFKNGVPEYPTTFRIEGENLILYNFKPLFTKEEFEKRLAEIYSFRKK